MVCWGVRKEIIEILIDYRVYDYFSGFGSSGWFCFVYGGYFVHAAGYSGSERIIHPKRGIFVCVWITMDWQTADF